MTHTPFRLPSQYVKNSYRHFIKNNNVNCYLNGIRIVDDILKAIIDGFKARKLLNDTLFVITSDHGFAFNDWSSGVYGALNNRLECGSQVPLMFYNPNLNGKHLNGQFTNMDILPSIMDMLLSSKEAKQHSKNVLLSLPVDKFKSILSPYEGMSLLRQTVKQDPERYIFHLVNPGNSYITIKQYPRKLVYNAKRNSVQLYHLGYDLQEQINLIRFENNRIVEYPKWLNTECNERSPRSRKWRWTDNYTLDQKFDPVKRFQSESRFKQKNCVDRQRRYGTVNLEEMLDWGEKTFQIAGAWRAFVKRRYVLGRSNVHKANGTLIA
jgi:arylsulfatase A-like enzyme